MARRSPLAGWHRGWQYRVGPSRRRRRERLGQRMSRDAGEPRSNPVRARVVVSHGCGAGGERRLEKFVCESSANGTG